MRERGRDSSYRHLLPHLPNHNQRSLLSPPPPPTPTSFSPLSSKSYRMQSMLNLTVSYGLPLSASAISHPCSLSKEMADHDRRRRAMKKLRSRARDGSHARGGLESRRIEEITALRAIIAGAIDGDFSYLLHDLASSCSAKAA